MIPKKVSPGLLLKCGLKVLPLFLFFFTFKIPLLIRTALELSNSVMSQDLAAGQNSVSVDRSVGGEPMETHL